MSRNLGNEAPVSVDQRFWWFLQSLEPSSSAYHMPLVVRLHGRIDSDALGASLRSVVERHEILRTVYPQQADGPIQRILPAPDEIGWTAHDVSQADDPYQEAQRQVRRGIAAAFNLQSDLPFRILLIRLGDDDWVLACVFHHIAVDAWTARLLLNELRIEYEARVAGAPVQIEAPAIRFVDFTAWELDRLSGPAFDRGIDFWREHLQGASSTVAWPAEPHGPPTSGHLRASWDADLVAALRSFAAARQVSVFLVVQASLAAFLARFTGHNDLTFGIPVAKRERPELRNLIGCLINSVPLRSVVPSEVSFDEWLRTAKATWESTTRHQWIPLETITRRLNTERQHDPSALFEILLTYFPGDPIEKFADLQLEPFEVGARAVPRVALDVTIHDASDGLDVEFDYDASRLPHAVAQQLFASWAAFLTSTLQRPDAAMATRAVMSAETRAEIVSGWSVGPRGQTEDHPAHALMQRWAIDEPERVALVFDGGQWTYEELNTAVNRIASQLPTGVARHKVGVCIERGPALVAAMLAIMKSGATYVALTPGLPGKRLAYMVDDSGMSAVLCDEAGAAALSEISVTTIDVHAALRDGSASFAEATVDPEDLAYILYTSGTTGRPKGVAIPHRALSNLVQMRDAEDVRASDYAARRFVFASQCTFDMSVAQIFPTLANGASLAIPPADLERSPGPFMDWLIAHGVTDVEVTPTHLQMLSEAPVHDPSRVPRRIYTGGEALTPALCEALFARWGDIRLRNLYGPTEMCNAQVARNLCDPAAWADGVPIGQPCHNHGAYVVDAALELVAPLARGELCLTGAGEARGYHGKPRLTAAAFVPCPYADESGARMYRTGDVARWRRTGVLDYDGRLDDQLQVRGVRVELGAVEACLESIAGVRRAAVRAEELGQGRATSLIAYVLFEGEPLSPAAMREQLAEHLAEAAIPNVYVQMDHIPVTASGKIDRAALQVPQAQMRQADRLAPQTSTQRALAEIWSEVLELDEVGINESFFEIGGHSLLAVRIQGRITETLGVSVPLHTLFATPTIAELARVVQAQDAGGPAVPRAEYDDVAPLSADQRRMWFLQRLDPQSTAYHVPLVDLLRGPLDASALQRASQALVDRHEVLRTVVDDSGDDAVQRILPRGVRVPWETVDLQTESAPHQRARSIVDAVIATPFDLRTEPPLRIKLLQTAEDEHVLVVLFHHIAIDEWTTGLAVGELLQLYTAYAAGQDPVLPDLPLQYADYAFWQNAQLSGPAYDASVDFWTSELGDAPDSIAWPFGEQTQHPDRPAGTVRFQWSHELADSIQSAARAHRTTTFMVLHALFAGFLARATSQHDVTIGVPVTTRDRPELQQMLGFLLNTVPIRSRVPAAASFDEWLDDAIERWRVSSQHHWIPLEEIVRTMGVERQSGALPLFDVFFTYVPSAGVPPRFGELEVSDYPHGGLVQAKAAMNLLMQDGDAGIEGILEFDAARFGKEDADRFAAGFMRFATACLRQPAAMMGAHEVLAPAQRSLLDEWMRSSPIDVPDTTVHGAFAECARKTPNAIALIGDDEQLTYAEVDARANALAAVLRRHGVGRDHVTVGVNVERSPLMVVSLMAILKAGGAYVPLEPDQPDDRLAYIAKNAGVRVVVSTTPNPPAWLAQYTLVDPDSVQEPAAAAPAASTADDSCYVLYTSGSTGRPKGVVVSHRAVINMCWAHVRDFGISPADIGLLNSPISFDASVVEMFPILLSGAALVVLRPQGERDADYMAERIRSCRVTNALLVPVLLDASLRADGLSAANELRNVMTGGEVVRGELSNRFYDVLPRPDLVNIYGPTEACVYSTYWRCDRDVDEFANPIGRAIGNDQVYLLDPWGRFVGDGTDAEIVIAGAGLADGYAGMPRRTAATFVPDPHGSVAGGRRYLTGDIARWNRDGQLVFLRRNDDQVQLFGVRTEPGEVEAALSRGPRVRSAAIRVVDVGSEGNEKALAAYVVGESEFDLQELKAYVEANLPAHMSPRFWQVLAQMPTTASGKIDRRALPDPGAGNERVEPRTDLERRLVELWKESLAVDRVGVTDNYFKLGGHSLLASRLHARISAEMAVDFPLRALFDSPTIEGLAEVIQASDSASTSAVQRRDDKTPAVLSAGQRRLWFLQELDPHSAAYHVPVAVRFDGAVDPNHLKAAAQRLSDRHEILRTRFPKHQGDPIQQILDPGHPVTWEQQDLRHVDNADEEVGALLRERVSIPFDLARDTALRVSLFQLDPDKWVLLLLFHHIALDEWTMGLAVAELREFYEAQVAGRSARLPGLPIQYADFAAWEAQRLAGDELQVAHAYWRETLRGAHDSTSWPFGSQPSDSRHPAGSVSVRFDAQTSRRLRDHARAQQTTLFTVLLSAFAAFVARYSGQTDLTIGLPATIRDRPELQGLVGFFLNTVPLRLSLSPSLTFDQCLRIVQDSWRGSEPHQWVPLDEIVQAVGARRSVWGLPLFDTMFTYVAGQPTRGDFGGVHVEPIDFGGLPDAKTSLSVVLGDDGDCIVGTFEYDEAQFRDDQIASMAAQFASTARLLLDDPQVSIGAIPRLDSEDRIQQSVRAEGPAMPAPNRSVVAMVQERVRAQPDAVALTFAEGSWTYAELDRRANHVARQLVAMGIGPERTVGVCVQRSPHLLAALLGTLHSGGAYVALQPNLPPARLEFMAADANLSALIVDEESAGAFDWQGPTIVVDDLDWSTEVEAVQVDVDAENLAYILYTSGTTGRPKGVLMRHAAVANLVATLQRHELFTSNSVVLWKTPYGFDVSVSEIFNTLVAGGTLVVAPPGAEREPAELARAISEQGITTLRLVPTALQLLLDHGDVDWTSVRTVICAGEALTTVVAERLFAASKARLFNLLGATETCVDTTYWECRPGESVAVQPVGGALHNYRVYALDELLSPIASGHRAEFCVGGEGLARGYRNMPSRTALSFAPDSNARKAGSRLYRTGDEVVWSDDSLHYVGRIDHQLQVRGNRVELTEVEANVAALDGVAQVAVLAVNEQAGKADALNAYIVADAGRSPVAAGRARVKLPNGMSVAELNPHETRFLYNEIFAQRHYVRHGITLSDDAFVVDVGANIGLFSVFVGLIAPHARILALEPVPELAQIARANTALYAPNAEVLQCGAADSDRMAEFTYYPGFSILSGAHAGKDTSELVRAFEDQRADGIDAAALDEVLAARLAPQKIDVQLASLSRLLSERGSPAIDLLKVDAEGAELEILGAISEDDWTRIRQVVTEVHGDDNVRIVRTLLQKHGFDVHVEQEAALSTSTLYNVFAISRAAEHEIQPDAEPSVAVPVVEGPTSLSAKELRSALAERVPEYFIPSTFVFVDELPRSASGKIDRAKLQQIVGDRAPGQKRGPTTDTERVVAQVWLEHLPVDDIGIDEDFFEVGGHSLLAVRLLGDLSTRLGVTLTLRELFEATTIAALARLVDTVDRNDSVIPRATYDDVAPLSADQRRMWFLQRLDPNSTAYHVPFAVELRGALDPDALHETVQALVDRHEILRTTFPEQDDEAVQRILPPGTAVAWEYADLHAASVAAADIRTLLTQRVSVPFDLASDMPVRAALYRTGPQKHVFLLLFHHIAVDEWTTGLAVAELRQTYAQRHDPVPLEPPQRQYADYAIWQQLRMQSAAFQQGLSFWNEHLHGANDHVKWPVLRAIPSAISSARSISIAWDSDLTAAVRAYSAAERTSTFAVLHAAFAAFLSVFSGQRDLTIGVPVTARDRAELQDVIGFLLNTVPFRARIAPGTSFSSWLAESTAAWRTSAAHQWIPIDEIVKAAGVDRASGRLPLFDVIFTYVPAAASDTTFGNLEAAPFPFDIEMGAKAALSVSLGDGPDGFEGTFTFDASRLTAAGVQEMVEQFGRFVAGCMGNPSAAMHEHSTTGPSVPPIVRNWSAGPSIEAPNVAVTTMFERAVQRAPQDIALVFEDGHWTYAELNQRADRVCSALLEMGVSGQIVGVSIPRSAELVAVLIGVLKSGAAYVALDPSVPRGRLRQILSDTNPGLVIADHDALGDAYPTVGVQQLFDTAAPRASAVEIDLDELAYVLHTSGTTGLPKGVMVPHRALAGVADGFAQTVYDLRSEPQARVFLSKASYGFDMFVGELFPALVAGARVAIAPAGAEADPQKLARTIASRGVTDVRATPSLLQLLVDTVDPRAFASVRRVYSGAEALTTELVATLRKTWGSRMWNMYGPTEMCVAQAGWELDGSTTGEDVVPIGSPTARHQLHIVGPDMALRAPGIDGEIMLSGPGQARGYWAKPAQTALAFVPNPWGEPGDRLYRTGDVGRWADGRVAYRGRRDDQLQVHGVRVELDAVRAHVESLPQVRQAAIAPIDERGGRAEALVAYVVLADDAVLDVEAARSQLAELLHRAVVPGRFVQLDEMPLNASGKIDRSRLPRPEEPVSHATFVGPRTPLEHTIAEVWQRLLKRESISIHANFFELGGHSLLAARIRAELVGELGVDVPLRALFEAPSIAALADAIVGRVGAAVVPIERANYGDSAPLSSDQRRMWFLQSVDPHGSAYNVPLAFRLDGQLRPDLLRAAAQKLVDRHEILRTTFPDEGDGPVQRIQPIGHEVSWEYVQTPEPQTQPLADRAFAPFDLSVDTPVRFSLVRVGPQTFDLLVLFHHIAIDEWTTALVLNEFRQNYEALCAGTDAEQPAPLIQYADYALWQQARLDGDELGQSLSFWKDHLDGAMDAIDWPVGEEPSDSSRPAEVVAFGWTKAVSDELRLFGTRHQATVFTVLEAAFTAYLSMLSGQRDVTVGIPVTMRERIELQSLVGCLVNTVPMRSKLTAGTSFGRWVADTDRTWRAVASHQWVPLDVIVARAADRPGADRPPLFDVMFTYVPARPSPVAFGDMEVDAIDLGNAPQAKATLSASVFEDPQGTLHGAFEYDAARFSAEDARALSAGFEQFVRRCLNDPSSPLEVHSTAAADLSNVRTWARGETFDVAGTVWTHAFEEMVAAYPERLAVCDESQRWTYTQLNNAANQIAERLRHTGVAAEVAVGIGLRRSVHLAAALIGVLKAGGVWVPLEPGLPAQRIAYMAQDSGVGVAVADDAGRNALGALGLDIIDVEMVEPDRPTPNLQVDLDPQHLAYRLYTSGTTGRPKGVMVTQQALMEHARSFAAHVCKLGPPQDAGARVVLVKASYTFDLFVSELFIAPAAGAALAIAPTGSEREPDRLSAFIEANAVTDMFATPSTLRLLLEGGTLRPDGQLRHVYSGGEALTVDVGNRVRSQWDASLWNLYGPTEMCCGQSGQLQDAQARRISTIGTALHGQWVGVIDHAGGLRTVGVDGEIAIAGVGEARGYAGMPAKTATMFLPCEYGRVGGRMYATGDVGRWTPDGAIEYRGRSDDQLQIRGVRVELAEVEAALEAIDGILEAAVRAEGVEAGRADLLVAYVVGPASEHPDEIKQRLRAALHDAAIPGVIVPLERLPRSAAGKIDRRALPSAAESRSPTTHAAPRTPAEHTVMQVWRNVLERDELGIHDRFFEVGGHSLLLVHVQREIELHGGFRLPLSSLIRHDTIAELGALLDRLRAGEDYLPDDSEIVVALRDAPLSNRVPLILVHPIGGNLVGYRALLAALPPGVAVLGLRSPGLADPGALVPSVEAMAELYVGRLRQHARLEQCQILGWSFGGTVAFEVARQLHGAGVMIENVVLVDAFSPDMNRARTNDADPFETFVADLVSTLGVTVDSAQAWRDALQGLSQAQRLSWLAQRLHDAGHSAFDTQTLGRLFAVFAAHVEAYRAHYPSAADLPVVSIAATGGRADTPERGWSAVGVRSLQTRSLPADHYSILGPAHAGVIADILYPASQQ